MKELQKLIDKYSNGIEIHNRIINNHNCSAIQKNRASHLLMLCESIVDDLNDLNDLKEQLESYSTE